LEDYLTFGVDAPASQLLRLPGIVTLSEAKGLPPNSTDGDPSLRSR